MTLNDRKWKEFFIAGDKGLFDISSTASGIDKNKLNIEGGDIPYLTRSNETNGINLFISDKQDSKWRMDEKNVITIGLDTQTVFYQPYKFYTGQNIQVLRHQKINKDIAMFIISMLKVQMEKFNWGGNGATLGRLCRTKMMLPVDENGDPDWAFMEQYIQDINEEKRKHYLIFCKEQLASIGELVNIKSFSEIEWKPFYINDIFKIDSGKRLESYNMVVGKRPFIGSTDSRNGITNYIANKNASLDRNVLGVNYNGGTAISFYHPYECVFSDDVKRFHLKEYTDNKFVLLFFKTIILQQKNKYSYAYKLNSTRMKRQIIMLPVNDAGNPDYEYMEQYIKNLMIKKYKAYLEYVEK